MSSLDILNIFLQICEGVKAFHEAKPEPLAHRDLKTANIVLNDDGIPIIMDLGKLNFIILINSNYKYEFLSLDIKHFLGSVATARVQVCGTQAARTLQDLAAERCSMPYRAPELFNVESYCMVDERTDIWVRATVLQHLP